MRKVARANRTSQQLLFAAALAAVLQITNVATATGQTTTDLVAFGGAGWGSVPVASANGNGSFSVANNPISNFAGWASTPGVTVAAGDFNGDGRTDLAAFGGAGWASVPVAFSNGSGAFVVTNSPINSFATWAATPGVKVVTGDFNADGRTDLAAFAGAGWGSVPVAFSNGNGSFTVVNSAISNFAGWASTPGVTVVTGDFNGDGRTDLAAFGGAGWGSVPVAFSNGNGSFSVANSPIFEFAGWVATPGVKVIAADFNGDGRTDLAAFGGAGWGSVPVAFSTGSGAFTVLNTAISNFAGWAATPGVQVVTGEFNGDGRADLAAFGGAGWGSVPVAFSNGNGSFGVVNAPIANFAGWVSTPGVKVVTGDFNGDGETDLAAFGGAGWGSVPVAFSNGNGSFGVVNSAIFEFAGWVATPGVTVLAGNFR